MGRETVPSIRVASYIISQVLGAIVAAGLIYLIASGRDGFALSGSNPLATNGFGTHSPGGYSLLAAFVTEVVLTFIFYSLFSAQRTIAHLLDSLVFRSVSR